MYLTVSANKQTALAGVDFVARERVDFYFLCLKLVAFKFATNTEERTIYE